MLTCIFLVINLTTFPINKLDCRVAVSANQRCKEIYGTGLRKLIKREERSFWAICKNKGNLK
jgi:hypothetical protein